MATIPVLQNVKVITTADGTQVSTSWELIHNPNGETVIETTATAGGKTHVTRHTLGAVEAPPVGMNLAALQAAVDAHRLHAAEVAHARDKLETMLAGLT